MGMAMQKAQFASALAVILAATPAVAQDAPAPAGPAAAAAAGPARAPAQQWWVEKTLGGVYPAPMKPIWRLADLKKMHPGQNNWQQQIIKDPEQEASYNSGAPGSKYGARIHPDTPSLFVVVAGTMDFTIQGQQPVHAKRGSLVNIMKTTVFSYEVTGEQNALWVEVNPRNYQTLFPTSEPQPAATKGGKVIKVAFPARPGAYAKPNQPHWNLFDGIAACEPAGARVLDDHIFSSPLLGYVNPADNKCGGANPRGNVGNAPLPGGAALPAFNPKSTFGHLHAGPAEWWIVQVGQISGKFENQGEFIASEGDVLYAAPMTWHQMRAVAPSGPSVRLAMGGYELINMNNTENGGN
jgi:mannose-6-phosphate isomerase-like protein (cupin superfamily)